ncbi:F0F1 ATP synthase subunit B family protein [Hephaestia mangrovi]|uniref:F0F1 ATP synthase subunit B family protein n=1 Tax=Hephaestia mangrovi TaxID=2873268 RepID=UPI001CA6907A|nr:hypothetical protein [Hephaestia mangrovi]MBY8826535.1 hypothetical protein [Hephaestia mangrovi]
MRIDWWTLALQAINVLILIWLLTRFLYRPVMRAIADRQAAATKLLADAAAAKQAATETQAKLEAQDHAFAAEADKRRTALHSELDAERATMLAKAKADGDALIADARKTAAADQARLEATLQAKAGDLAGRMTAKLLERLPPAVTTDALFAALIDLIRALPEDERKTLSREPLTVVTPAVLDAQARARYTKGLEANLPGMPKPHFAVDPALIAGFELWGPHALVHNSWRADLDRLLAALKEGDHAERR